MHLSDSDLLAPICQIKTFTSSVLTQYATVSLNSAYFIMKLFSFACLLLLLLLLDQVQG